MARPRPRRPRRLRLLPAALPQAQRRRRPHLRPRQRRARPARAVPHRRRLPQRRHPRLHQHQRPPHRPRLLRPCPQPQQRRQPPLPRLPRLRGRRRPQPPVRAPHRRHVGMPLRPLVKVALPPPARALRRGRVSPVRATTRSRRARAWARPARARVTGDPVRATTRSARARACRVRNSDRRRAPGHPQPVRAARPVPALARDPVPVVPAPAPA